MPQGQVVVRGLGLRVALFEYRDLRRRGALQVEGRQPGFPAQHFVGESVAVDRFAHQAAPADDKAARPAARRTW